MGESSSVAGERMSDRVERMRMWNMRGKSEQDSDSLPLLRPSVLDHPRKNGVVPLQC